MIGLSRFVAMMWIVGLAGCTPEITFDTYYCGSERLCPPGQVCDDNSFTCTSPLVAEQFSCANEAMVNEPDDVAAQAAVLGAAECGRPLLSASPGCIDDVNDKDFFEFEIDTECAGNSPRVEVQLIHPVALVPLVVDVLDGEQTVVATGELCESVSVAGSSATCAEIPADVGTYFLRITSDRESGLDCDGGCHFNQYAVSAALVLN